MICSNWFTFNQPNYTYTPQYFAKRYLIFRKKEENYVKIKLDL
jgi:hypothetical protein